MKSPESHHHHAISIGRGGVIHRVLPQLLSGKADIYIPSIACFGPYHYHKRSGDTFRPSEALKNEVIRFLCPGDKADHLRGKILERIEHVRSHYATITAVTDDQELSEMMLRDSCLAIAMIKLTVDECKDQEEEDDTLLLCLMLYQLGFAGLEILFKDFRMLENQIPLFVLKLVLELLFGQDKGRAMLCRYLFVVNFDLDKDDDDDDDDNVKKNIHEMIDRQLPPLHLLEANRMILIKQQPPSSSVSNTPTSIKLSYKLMNRPFRSVTDLKARGIRVSPSSSCLTDFRFSSSTFTGHLQIPIRYVSRVTKVFLSNIIAFEMSPEMTTTNLEVTSYVNFMKSLLVGPQDVKELRDKGILFSDFGNDDEVLKVFREIDTYGVDGLVHVDVKARIERHCRSKAKTWMAELANTKFRSPWTTISLVAAVILLSLTFLQTLFTIHPAAAGNNKNTK